MLNLENNYPDLGDQIQAAEPCCQRPHLAPKLMVASGFEHLTSRHARIVAAGFAAIGSEVFCYLYCCSFGWHR